MTRALGGLGLAVSVLWALSIAEPTEPSHYRHETTAAPIGASTDQTMTYTSGSPVGMTIYVPSCAVVRMFTASSITTTATNNTTTACAVRP
jgi:hypothetical protein